MWRSLVTAAVLTSSMLAAPVAFGADHADSPSVLADPASDITDVFAWMNDDNTHLNLVMDVFPFADASSRFSDSVQYVWYVQSGPEFGNTQQTTQVIAQFNSDQTIELWVGDHYVTGDASSEAGLGDDTVRVFAGLRNDPFFMNLTGFLNAADTVANADLTGVTFVDGCPELDEGTVNTLLGQLTTGGDTLAGANVLSIVVRIDKTLVNGGGDVLSVHAQTHTRQ